MANVSSSNGLENRPKLRFPGFDEPWKTNVFDKIFTFLPNNTLSRADLASCGDVLNVHYGDILIKYGSILDVESNKIPYIATGKENKKQCYLSDGDIIIADTAEDETVGKCTEIINIRDAKIEAGLHTIPCHPQTAYAPMYLGYYMNSPHYHKQLVPLMQGVKVLSVSKSNIGNTLISAPVSYSEQEKIVKMLYLLDIRMYKQQEIIETLKKYKRGLLSYYFSPTHMVHLGNVESYNFADIAYRRTEKYDPRSGKDSLCIELEHIEQETGRILGSTSAINQNSIKNVCRKNDVLFGKLRPYLRKYALVKQKCVCSSEIWTLVPKKTVLPQFLFYLVQSEEFIKVANISSGTKMPRAEWSNVEKATFYIPSTDVQQKIILQLEGIDALIMSNDKIRSQLNNLKRGLLQQLFI